MDSLYKNRSIFFIAGTIFLILGWISTFILEGYESNNNYRKYELWQKIQGKFFGLGIIFIVGGGFTFLLEGLFNTLGGAVKN